MASKFHTVEILGSFFLKNYISYQSTHTTEFSFPDAVNKYELLYFIIAHFFLNYVLRKSLEANQ